MSTSQALASGQPGLWFRGDCETGLLVSGVAADGFTVAPVPEPLAVAPSTDLFSAEPASAAAGKSAPRRRTGAPERKPTAKRLVVAAVAGVVLSYLGAMPFVLGHPLPVGTLFTLGLVAVQALRRHYVLQRLLAVPVVALFFAFGFPLLLTPFPAEVRYVFFSVMVGAAVAIYEWAMDGL